MDYEPNLNAGESIEKFTQKRKKRQCLKIIGQDGGKIDAGILQHLFKPNY